MCCVTAHEYVSSICDFKAAIYRHVIKICLLNLFKHIYNCQNYYFHILNDLITIHQMYNSIIPSIYNCFHCDHWCLQEAKFRPWAKCLKSGGKSKYSFRQAFRLIVLIYYVSVLLITLSMQYIGCK